jgi:hypothetical protein
MTFDCVCGVMGMCVNAAKTELMAIVHDWELPGGVQLSNGNARYVDASSTLVVLSIQLLLGTRRSTLESPKPVAGLLRCSICGVSAS